MLGGEALIWDRRSQALHRLSPTATATWDACGQSPDIETIVGQLTRGGPRADIAGAEREIERCIDDLVAAGLLPAARTIGDAI